MGHSLPTYFSPTESGRLPGGAVQPPSPIAGPGANVTARADDGVVFGQGMYARSGAVVRSREPSDRGSRQRLQAFEILVPAEAAEDA